MRRRTSRAAETSLESRLESLAHAVELAEGRVAADALAVAGALIERSAERQRIGVGLTVAALLGATGSGKSSLLNAVVGADLARVDARRPTTTQPLGVVWGEASATELLDWLDVPDRLERGHDPRGLDGLVLLDLPDIDSTSAANRAVAARLAQRVDALVWVLDPQKYADGVVHEEYLQAMADHASVSVVVLNQVDRLDPGDVPGVVDHLRRLLAQDGMTGVEVLLTSAREGTGVDELTQRLATVAGAGRAARDRLTADVTTAVRTIATSSGADLNDGTSGEVPAEATEALTSAAARAAGVPTVTAAVQRAYSRRAARHVGWPPVRWLARLRPDPLRRLHLEAGDAPTSLPPVSAAHSAAVTAGVHDLAWSTTGHLPAQWRERALTDAEDAVPGLVDALDRTVAGTDLRLGRTPAWWRVLGLLQAVLLTAAIAGALWLGALAGAGYLRLPVPETPMAGRVPWPTALLLGGVLAGVLLAVIGRVLARWGARRRARAARRDLMTGVRATVERSVVVPLEAELDRYADFRTALRSARG
ncbi:GTPase [Georgenia wangjunii]|uniref:GTPase n=1 Tax=Georgenia wangjunii TaxID=3117730 RepID=UPI002F261439